MTPVFVYAPQFHFWRIAGKSGFWSTQAKAYVDAVPFVNFPTSDIASEAELRDTLTRQGFARLAPGYVPASVYMWQAKTAIAAIGKLTEADEAIDASNNPALILAWHTAPEISRASPAVAAIGQLLGLSVTDIDNLFIQAESYKV